MHFKTDKVGLKKATVKKKLHYFQSPHQVDMKNVVECPNGFFAYFNALETYALAEAQVLQILEENGFHNGIEIKVLGNASNTTRNQSSSDTEVQESMENLGRGDISSNARIQEWT